MKNKSISQKNQLEASLWYKSGAPVWCVRHTFTGIILLLPHDICRQGNPIQPAISLHRRQAAAGYPYYEPLREYAQTMGIAQQFYHKYYDDNNPRHIILGINPGRFGGGLTGIPFTDSKRLKSECGIDYEGKITHEPSSVFVYEVINAYGGPEAFYKKFYINSLFPLGFTTTDANGKEKNYNYYDSRDLITAVTGDIIENVKTQIGLGVSTDVCFCFGTGKNETFLRKLNLEHGFFKKIIALEHPRFIMQYKAMSKQVYIDKYLAAFHSVAE